MTKKSKLSENKETRASPNLFPDKEVQTEVIPNSTKVFVPIKRQNPKPTVPVTKEFLDYHQRKYEVQRTKIKFKPKLDVITEAEENGNEPELHELASAGEIVSETAVVDKTVTAKNSDEIPSKSSEHSGNEELHLKVTDDIKSRKKKKRNPRL
ncbi:hypothetical protein AVEN_29806-1 [Araneus ventricosus]|uniref:Uncharacterized protein n=1 Tax=Araneus ventricosus TaxID=182803 RepID=A0A4Y2GFE9_ARAVE|nr:hypothetical protein AVEN_29806-1 [Araneus ventricosus]